MAGRLYWIASYPKSGNTWTRLFLDCLANDGNPIDINSIAVERARNISHRKDFNRLMNLDADILTNREILKLRPEFHRRLSAELESQNITQCRKVHDANVLTPNDDRLFQNDATAGVIYIVRDPRDVVISLANHMSKNIDWAIDFMANNTSTLSPQVTKQNRNHLPQILRTWDTNVRTWIESDLKVLRMRYEDMKANPFGRLSAIATFLGRDKDPEIINKAVINTSFDALQAQETEKGFVEIPKHEGVFFRKGIVGEWKNTLTADQIRRIEHNHKAMMKRLGYL